jgi:predicted O-methyltransferase YrrM
MFEKFTRMDARLHAYLLAHQPPEHEVLSALREQTEAMPDGFMQTTPEQGHLLALLVRLVDARRVLDIGTFTGTSALAMALALLDEGRVVTCDMDEGSTTIAEGYWQSAGMAQRIELRIAPAIETLTQLEREGGRNRFDLAFIDADKTRYEAYYECYLRLLRPGGLIVLDNTLRRGRVADPNEVDADTVALRGLNTKIAADERVDRVLLPIATGMTLARRR